MFRKKNSQVVKTETKTFTKFSDGEKITVTETIETTADGTVTTSTKTLKEAMSSSKKTTVNSNHGFSEFKNLFGNKSKPAAPKSSVSNNTAAATVSSKATSPKNEDFQKESLQVHNNFRQKHGAAPLKLNAQLCSYAQEWANHLASTRSFQHRSNNKYGENLYSKMTSDPSYVLNGKEAVESWYSEIKKYSYDSARFSSGTGHFTQVVWKGSKDLGIAYAKAPGGWFYVVANYDPPGNMMGDFKANVFPPK